MPVNGPHIAEFGQFSSGLFIKRISQEADPDSPDSNSEARDAFERLTDCSRLDYLPPTTTRPGVGLAGTLWSEASTSSTLAAVQEGVQSIGTNIQRRVGMLAGLQSFNKQLNNSADSVVWREVGALAQDPDQVRF